MVNPGHNPGSLDLELLDATSQRGRGTDWAWLTGSRVPQNEMTPLHVAATLGHEAVVGALLAAGANIEVRDSVRGQGGGRG